MSATTRLAIALALTALVAIGEAAGGFATGSVALLSDAAHVAMDVLALAIALAARAQAKRPATPRQSYGFARAEVLAALGNGALLFTVTAFIIVEAIRRLMHPQLPDGHVMALIAAVGVSMNVVVGLTLAAGHHGHHHHKHDAADTQHDATSTDGGIAATSHKHQHAHTDESAEGHINLRAALLHVVGDALGGAAAVVGGIAIALTGAAWVDPLLSLAVAAIICVGIVRIAREAIEVLLESAPSHADTDTVRTQMMTQSGVVDVHDLHIWSLNGSEYLLSAHVLLVDRHISEASAILRTMEATLRKTYGITHVTVQFECESCEESDRIICTQRGGSE